MRKEDSPDKGKNYFRSGNRIFNLNGAWYFATREGDQGPFDSREAVVREMARYANELNDLRQFKLSCESRKQLPAEDVSLSILPKEEPFVDGNLVLNFDFDAES